MPGPISGDVREMILKVREFFLLEKQSNAPIIPFAKVRERVAAATGISTRLLTTIVKEGEVAAALGTKIATPGQQRRTRRDKIVLNDDEMEILKAKIHEHINLKDEAPSMRKFLQTIKDELDFKCSKTTLRRLIKQIAPSSFSSAQAQRSQSSKKNATKVPSASQVPRVPKTQSTAKSTKSPSTAKPPRAATTPSATVRDSTKNLLRQWLRSNGIKFSPEASKEQLVELIKLHRSRQVYTVNAAMNLLEADVTTPCPQSLLKLQYKSEPSEAFLKVKDSNNTGKVKVLMTPQISDSPNAVTKAVNTWKQDEGNCF